MGAICIRPLLHSNEGKGGKAPPPHCFSGKVEGGVGYLTPHHYQARG